MDEFQTVYETCNVEQQLNHNLEGILDPIVGNSDEMLGIGYIGAICLYAETILQDPTNITTDVIIGIVLHIMGGQGTSGFDQFIEYTLWF